MNLPAVLSDLTQTGVISGGIHTPPEARLLLMALALLLNAKDVLETGYDAGVTTEALAQTWGRVVAVDDGSEYPDAKAAAKARLVGYNNVRLVSGDALEFLRQQPAESFDLIFIDDLHYPPHVELECCEVRRILRPGGMVAFHDTIVCGLWLIVDRMFPDWQRLNLPCRTKATQVRVNPGTEDFGLGLVRKPE